MPRVLSGVLKRRLPRWLLLCAACMGVYAGLIAARTHPANAVPLLCVLLPVTLWSLGRHGFLAVLLVSAFGCSVGLWRGTMLASELRGYTALRLHAVTITGRAAEDAVYGERSQLAFTLDDVRAAGLHLPGSIKVSGFGEAAIYRGDIVQATGRLYPTRGDAQASVSFAQLHMVRRGGSVMDTLRQRFVAGMQSALPEPQASFGLGLLIGQRSTLPPNVAHDLLAAGLTHIIAVSGYNLTIMVEAARRLLGKRSTFQTAAACLLLIAAFLLITGNSPSVVRAAMVSTLSILCWYYGRTIRPIVLLGVTASVTALANPLYVWGNVSWYLSFLAFFGVLVVGPLVTRRLYGRRRPPLLVQIFIESVCAELMTLPYVLYIFGQMSLVALPANVLIVAAVPLAMALAALAGIAGMITPALAGWAAWPAKLLLRGMLATAGLLARVPHAFVEQIGFSAGMLAGAYACVLVMIVALWHRVRQNAIITETQEEQGSERTFQMVDY